MLYVGFAALSIFIVTACVLDVLIEETLWSEFDQSLQDRLLNLTQLVEQDAEGLEFEWEESEPASTPMLIDGEVVTAWVAGKVVSVFPSGTEPLAINAERGIHSVTIDGDHRGRAAVLRFVPRFDMAPDTDAASTRSMARTITLAVGRSTRAIDSTIGRLRLTLLLTTVVGSLATLAVTWLAVDRGLTPIASTTKQLAKLDANSMSQRITDTADHVTELQPLVGTINELLDRLQQTLQRERSFTADVAHELRTPLAGLHAKLEVALSRPRESSEHVRTLAACLEITDQTASIVESLLGTTTANRETLMESLESVNAKRLLQQLIDDRQLALADRRLAIGLHVPDDLACTATVSTLEIAFSTLR